jgi:hypothetical protein
VLLVSYLNVENAELALNCLLNKQGTVIQVDYICEKSSGTVVKEIVSSKNELSSKGMMKEEVKSLQKLNEIARYSTPFQSRQKTLPYTPVKKSMETIVPSKM